MESPALELYTHVIDSPIGALSLAVHKRGGVHAIRFGRHSAWPEARSAEANKYACGELALELSEYFAGKRHDFSLELRPVGTEFQRAVWQAIARLPWGSVVSYSELARRVGRRDATRAVANAVGLNPIPILIPCHRIILKSGAPGLYAVASLGKAQGQAAKLTLLSLEGIEFGASPC